MPQKDDLLFIRDKGSYYQRFLSEIMNEIPIIDLTDSLVKRKDLDKIFSDDNQYGGHYSKYGNKIIAKIIHNYLNDNRLL